MGEQVAVEMSAFSQQPVGEGFAGSPAMEAADSWSLAWAKARGWASGGGACATTSPVSRVWHP